jgi:hypothetical protein
MAKQAKRTKRKGSSPEFLKNLDESPSGTVGKAKRLLSRRKTNRGIMMHCMYYYGGVTEY